MAELIYTPNPATIARFLKHIQSAGVPTKMTVQYLVGVGFKSKNDRYLIGIMKSLRFVDSSGTPTEFWSGYRDKSKSKEVLGKALRDAYSDLFVTYPDADRKDADAIRNFFGSRSKVAESTLRLAVTTFRTLAGEATFSSEPSEAGRPAAVAVPGQRISAPEESPREHGRRGAPPVTINIELQLPETDNADVYDKLFAAMRKYLLD